MTVVKTKTSFTLPLPKEPGIKAVRLFNACKAAVDECKKNPSNVKAIYENAKVVPADLVGQVTCIDPCSLGDPGVLVSYEDTGCLWVRHDKSASANLEFLTKYLREVILEAGFEKFGFEYCHDCCEPHVNTFGGGIVFFNQHRGVRVSGRGVLQAALAEQDRLAQHEDDVERMLRARD